MRSVLAETDNPQLNSVAMFAARDIAADEELTINYMQAMVPDHTPVHDAVTGSAHIRCRCGARTCTGFMFDY